MAEFVRRAHANSVRTVDGVAVFWVVLWLVVGIWVGYSVWDLSRVGDTVSQSGRTLDGAAQALRSLREVPLIGDRLESLGDDVRATAADIVARGRDTEASLRRLAVLLGLVVSIVPALPVLAGYLPARLQRERQVHAIRRALLTRGADGGVEGYLAYQAICTMRVDELPDIPRESWPALSGAQLRALADLELQRLGLHRYPATDDQR